MQTIEEQYIFWLEEETKYKISDVNTDNLKDLIIKDLSYVSSMDVKEYTLYQKWSEIKRKYPVKKIETLFGEETQLENIEDRKHIDDLKNDIWKPENIEKYINISPVLHEMSGDYAYIYNTYRNFTSTQKNNNNIGRNLYFVVKDEKSLKALGLICISSDFLDLSPRDKYIGWSRQIKTQEHMINHTAIGSTIIPFQPFGYNCVGGKLLALLCLSNTVQKIWKEKYGDVLVGVTTTSLYGTKKPGGLSQYDNLEYWMKMDFTEGSVSYEISKPVEFLMLNWLRINFPKKYFEWYVATKETGQPYKRDHRNRARLFVFSKLGIPKQLISSEHRRGIYYSSLYDNSNDFLRKEIREIDLKKSFDTSVNHLTNIWKTNHAKNRVFLLKKKNKFIDEILFYDDLIYLSWEDTKLKYLSQVGR